jgi:hypothetical protein
MTVYARVRFQQTRNMTDGYDWVRRGYAGGTGKVRRACTLRELTVRYKIHDNQPQEMCTTLKVNKRLQGAVEEALRSSTTHRERDTDILQGLTV